MEEYLATLGVDIDISVDTKSIIYLSVGLLVAIFLATLLTGIILKKI